MAREREICISCVGPSPTTRREITGTRKSIQRKLVTDEGKRHSSRTVEGRTELDLVQDEVDEAKRLLDEARVEVQAAQNKVTEAAFRVGQAMEEMSQSRKLLESSCRSMKRPEEAFAARHRKAMWERWYEAIMEGEKPQSNKDTTEQCIDFCEATTSKVHAVLQHAPSDLRGGTFQQHPRVLVATVRHQENPHLYQQQHHAAMFQVLRVLAVTESQETEGFLDEIQQQPSVFVLSGPATVITDVATASAFLADGWSTESVSSVVKTARTRQENHEKERAEHAYYSHMHDDVTISDTFPATVQGLDEGEHPAENTIPEDDQEDETEHSLSASLQTRRQISRIDENMGHPSNRTLARVLRLGGAKRRFILAAAKHSCGACEAQKRLDGPIVSRSPNFFVFNDVVGLDLFFS